MPPDRLIAKLRQAFPEIARRFGVRSLGVFGSVSRGEATENSDIDMIVEFDGPATFDGFFNVQFYLEDLLGRQVDLATTKSIAPRLRSFIDRDLIRVP